MKDRIKSLLGNPFVLALGVIAYFAVIGPALFSASSTFAVLLGIAGAISVGVWIAQFPKLTRFRRNFRFTNPRRSNK